MRVLVSGASGLLGVHICRELGAAGHEVRAFHLARDPMPTSTGVDVDDFPGDVRDPAAVARALEGCEQVYHAAGIVSYARKDADRLRAVHVEGTRTLAEAAARSGVARFVYTSSVATIGHSPGTLADENTEYNFGALHIPYFEAKHAAEALMSAWARRGLPVVIVNPGGLIGPLAPAASSISLLRAIQKGWLPALPCGGLNLVSAEDAARGHLLAARHGRPGRRYILGGENLTHLEWARGIADALGVRAPARTLPAWFAPALGQVSELGARAMNRTPPALTRSRGQLSNLELFYSSGRAERELGYRPRPLHITLEKTVAWCEQRGHLSLRTHQAPQL